MSELRNILNVWPIYHPTFGPIFHRFWKKLLFFLTKWHNRTRSWPPSNYQNIDANCQCNKWVLNSQWDWKCNHKNSVFIGAFRTSVTFRSSLTSQTFRTFRTSLNCTDGASVFINLNRCLNKIFKKVYVKSKCLL